MAEEERNKKNNELKIKKKEPATCSHAFKPPSGTSENGGNNGGLGTLEGEVESK